MTTIAYRDGILAADRRVMNGGWIIPVTATKLRRLGDGRLVAWTGASSVAATFIDQFVAGEKLEALGKLGEETVYRVIMIELDGSVTVYEDGHADHQTDFPFNAWGSGGPAAIAAMHAGSSAKRAIEIAALMDPMTGGGVDVLVADWVPEPAS